MGLPPSPSGVTMDQSVSPPSPLDGRPVDLRSLDKVSRQSLSVGEEYGFCNSKYKDDRFTETGAPLVVLALCNIASINLAGGVSMTRWEGQLGCCS